MDEGFIVDLESSSDRQGADCLLHAPSFGKENEPLCELRPLDHLDNTLQSILYAVDELSLVASVDDNRPDPRTESNQPSSERKTTVLVLNVSRRDIDCEKTAIGVDGEMSLAAQHLLRGVVATVSVGSVAFDRLRVDDRQGWTGFTPSLFPVGHHEKVIDLLDMAPIGQEPPKVVADARRRQVLRHGVPRNAISLDIPDAVDDLTERMHARSTGTLGHRQHRLQELPLFVVQIARISLMTTIVLFPVLFVPHRPAHEISDQ